SHQPPPSALYTLSLHDALPIFGRRLKGQDVRATGVVRLTTTETLLGLLAPILAELRDAHPGILVEVVTSNAFFTLTRRDADIARSEEHTSELQSRVDLVCRLLL